MKMGYNRVFGYYFELSRSRQSQLPERFERRQSLANAERFTTPELKELEEKNIIAQNQLKDTQSSYDRTKVEYERLEQELEDLPRWQRSPC